MSRIGWTVLIAATCLVAAACSKEQAKPGAGGGANARPGNPTAKNANAAPGNPAAKNAKGPIHSNPGPGKATLNVLPTGRFFVDLLAEDRKSPHTIGEEQLTAVLMMTAGGAEPKYLPMAPKPMEGQTPEACSRYVGYSEDLLSGKGMLMTLKYPIGDETVRADFQIPVGYQPY